MGGRPFRLPATDTDGWTPALTVQTTCWRSAVGMAGHKGAVWAAAFNASGRYLATAGKDTVVRLWQVGMERQRRVAMTDGNGHGKDSNEARSQPCFWRQPVQQWEGHTKDVLDLSWSSSDFLLSASMDGTVRLWHVSKGSCVAKFSHAKAVTAVHFHPQQQDVMVTGCYDKHLRVWHIPKGRVTKDVSTRSAITAARFTPCGTKLVCGMTDGFCLFYNTKDINPKSSMSAVTRSMHLVTQVDTSLPASRPALPCAAPLLCSALLDICCP